MAIIYSYPRLTTTAATGDLLLITDINDDNKTKSVAISNLPFTNNSGTVTSVGISMPSAFAVANSPITGSDTIAITTTGGNPGEFLAYNGTWSTPASGSSYQAGDGIDIDVSTNPDTIKTDLKANGGVVIESTELAVDLGASSITGTLAVADGGTGATTLTGILKGNGTAAVTAGAGLGDLSNASFSASFNDASMYIGNGAPTGLIGSPTKTTAVGEGAGPATTSGSSNTLIGTNAGLGVTTGSTNTLIGADSGDTLTIGAGNVILGAGADSNANNVNASIAVGKNTVVNTGSVAIGDSASATGGGIALGRGATNTTANLALGSTTYPLVNTTDSGDVIGLATGQTPTKFIEVQIGAAKYYMALYDQA